MVVGLATRSVNGEIVAEGWMEKTQPLYPADETADVGLDNPALVADG